MKRPATKASLKRPAHNQILTILDMFSYCESDVTGIKFFYMSFTTINPIRSGLFQTVNDLGGGFKSPPLRSRKLLGQSSPYHICEFYQVFLA